ncbi:MAG: hypothetical protein KZQ95_14540 [Candidatus Thiodiazotropha sp. (ex Epidulcina cf. delphinae)]|nr:hypothetical protein [Candidatus Thiodiazotropha sp. (ex Epidulcina cf. delphinae)]
MNQRDKVINRFEKAVNTSLDNHRELVLALFGKRRKASLETVLVEQLVLSTTVAWEAFVSDLFVAYIAMKPKTYLDSLEKRINESITAKFGKSVARLTRFERQLSLSPNKIAILVDPGGWNISLSSADKLASKANNMLHATFAKKFSLDADDGAFIDFAVALRNFLGHRSAMSRRSLTEAHKKLGLGKNTPFNGPISNLGTYLKEKDATKKSRALLYAKRLIKVANTL